MACFIAVLELKKLIQILTFPLDHLRRTLCVNSSQTAGGCCYLCGIRSNPSQLNRISLRQGVHRSEGDIERPCPSMVNGRDIDSRALEAQRPACAAIGRVKPSNSTRSPDIRECGYGTKRLEAKPRDEAVDTVGASDGGHRTCAVVVHLVEGDRDRDSINEGDEK